MHLAVVPLGASNEKKLASPDALNPHFKNYSYSGGAEIKYLTAFNFSWGQLAAEYYFYWLHTYAGNPGYNIIHILRPELTIKLYKGIDIGSEYLWYFRDAHRSNASAIHVKTGESRIFLKFNFENF